MGWLALFLAIELPAVFNNTDDDTLSEFVWDFITNSVIGWVGVAILLGWLIKHFLFENENR